MADSIVGGLFGITPEMYQQQVAQQSLAQGEQLGSMSPDAFGRSMLYAGGAQLGRGIGGALGAVDPQLQLISMRNAVMKEVNPNDPNSIMEGARKLGQFDPVGANALALQARTAAELIARTAKENQQISTLRAQEDLARTGKKPTKVLEAEALADAKQALSLLEKDTPEYNRQKNIIAQIQSGDTDVIEIGVPNQPNMRQKIIINKQDPNAGYIPLGNPYSGLTSSINMPLDIKMTNQELDWRKQFLTENKPVIDQGANVRQSISLLSQSGQNPFAQAAFENTVVSAFGGDKQKSNAEIKRLVNAGSLDQRVANTLSNFFEGTSSVATKEDQKKVLEAVDVALEARYNNAAKNWSAGLEKAKVKSDLVIPKYNEVVGATPVKQFNEGDKVRNIQTGKMSVIKNGVPVPISE
jgi:hypothetical protein